MENRIKYHLVILCLISGLRVVVPETVKEGVDVSLTCSTSCPLSGSPSLLWKKDGRPVEGKKMNGNQLHLHPVDREDEGSYSCAVRGYENYATLPEKMNVMYVLSKEWSITYDPPTVCAVPQSSVEMSCIYPQPSNDVIQDAYWIKGNTDAASGLIKDPSYESRVHVQCGDTPRKCTLHISEVKSTDHGEYFCALKSNLKERSWTSTHGVKLFVTGLKVLVPEMVKEGVDVSLTCNTSCALSGSPSFLWMKEGRPVQGKKMNGNQLHLHPVSREDEGSYSCAVRGYENYATLPEKINVMYPAKDTWVDKHPPGETLAGSSVNLTLFSDANVTVDSYTWFCALISFILFRLLGM